MITDDTNPVNGQEDLKNNDMQQQTAENEVENTAAETTEDTRLQEELGKERDKFLRLFAEFENYKKRTAKERLELFSTASESVMTALLPVLDDFDRALAQIKEDDLNQHTEGFILIANKFRDSLSAKGLVVVEVNKGDIFNADIAEAVTQIPAGDEMKGKIVDVIEKGYKLGDKIIRYPKVVIGQ